jgi:hypothetical protein
MGTFTEKQLRFTFTLATNAKFQGDNNTLQIEGLRALADINYPGPPAFPGANVRIYGMKPSDMQALTGLIFQTLEYRRNSIQIEANDGSGWTTVFEGQIVVGRTMFDAMPDVYFEVQAQTLGFDLLNPATASTFPASASVENVCRTIALKMDPPRGVINHGVTAVFPGASYFAGTPAEQLRAAVKKAGIVLYPDRPGIIEIGVPGAPRDVPKAVLSPTRGNLVGYPSLDSVNLISVSAIFNPSLRFGAPLRIEDSQQLAANGDWIIYDCTHNLSSQMPQGPWFTRMTAQPPAIFSGPNAQ